MILPTQVMPRDVRDWQTTQQRVERAALATINRRLVAFNRFFQWTVACHLLFANAVEDISAIRLPQRQLKRLHATLLRRLFHAAKDHPRDYALIEVLVGTGVRVSELLQLCLSDLVLKERSGILTVRVARVIAMARSPHAGCAQSVACLLDTQPPGADESALAALDGRL